MQTDKTKYIITMDKQVRDELISKGFKLLQARRCLNQEGMWTFEYDGSTPLCFDIASFRSKCIVTDKLSMVV